MKKFLIFSGVFLAFLFLLFNETFTNTSGSPAGRSGGAGELTCATSSCHQGTPNSGPGSVSITTNAPNGEYMPGQTYTITATVDQTGVSKFGFIVLSGYNVGTNASTGTIQLTNPTETQQKASGNRNHVTHKTAGTSGSDNRSWSFDWVAPGSNTGEVTFFAALNATNNGGNRTGDNIYTTSVSLTEAAVSVDPELTQTPQIQVFPAYTNEAVTIRLENPVNRKVEISVMDLQGKTVYRSVENALPGTFEHSFAVNQWESGLYYVRVSGAGFVQTQKVVKY